MSDRLASRRSAAAANATAAPAPAQVYRIAPSAKPPAASVSSAAPASVTAASAAHVQPAPSAAGKAAATKPSASAGGGGLFSGLKGGFFNNSSSSSKPSGANAARPPAAASASAPAKPPAADDGIPFLRAAASGSSTSTSTSGARTASSTATAGIVLPEVQEAMKQTISSTDWCTPDFLAQLDGDDVLARGLADPRMAAVMDELSKNPQEALRKYGKDPNLQEFIRRFMGLMGSHLTAKAEIAEQTKQKPKQASTTTTGTAAPPSRAKIVDPDLHPDSDSEDADSADFLIRPAAQQQPPKQQLFVADRPREVDPVQMQRWLSDPRLRAVLSDPGTDRMLADIRADPRRVRQYENDARFKMLVEAGIIGRE